MKEYRVEYMNENAFHNMMMGGNNYIVNKIDVKAENAAEAIEIVKKLFPNDIVNESYVRAVEEIEAEAEKRKAEAKAEAEKKAAKKAAKEAFEKAHPEIVAERKRKAQLNRAKTEKRKIEEELKELKAKLDYYNKKIAELEEEN